MKIPGVRKLASKTFGPSVSVRRQIIEGKFEVQVVILDGPTYGDLGRIIGQASSPYRAYVDACETMGVTPLEAN